MSTNYAFIGAGNMAKAMIGGILSSGLAAPDCVTASNPSAPKLDALKEEFGIRTMQQGNAAAAAQADVLVLSVKPYLYETVIAEIRDVVKPETIVVMIAAGQTLSVNETRFGKPVKLVRVMPNTPALVGEAMSAVCFNANITPEDRTIVMAMLNSFGKAEEVPEKLMDAVTGVSGSSPAYVYMFIEALADSVVKYGIPRQDAYKLVAQTVLGSAKMVLETGEHPGKLKDNVCSPAGTTIQGVAALEEFGFRNAIIKATDKCFEACNKIK